MGKIKVDPSIIHEKAAGIRNASNLSLKEITKDTETNVSGNTTMGEQIDQIGTVVAKLKESLSTFAQNLDTMADSLKEADEKA